MIKKILSEGLSFRKLLSEEDEWFYFLETCTLSSVWIILRSSRISKCSDEFIDCHYSDIIFFLQIWKVLTAAVITLYVKLKRCLCNKQHFLYFRMFGFEFWSGIKAREACCVQQLIVLTLYALWVGLRRLELYDRVT